jgi:hypothetical protein
MKKPQFMMFSGGQSVDLNNFDPSELTIEELALSLARINRFAGHTKKGITYSVAEHSVWVSDNAHPGLAYPALMHDVEEAVFGDIPSPAKHLSKDIKVAGDKIRAQIWQEHGCFATELEWDHIHDVDYLALQTEARDLMHHNIEQYIPFPKHYSPTIFPLMNEDEIVQQFIDRFRVVSVVFKRWCKAEAAKKAERVA